MLKTSIAMKTREEEAAAALRTVLEQVPAITAVDMRFEPFVHRDEVAIAVHFKVSGKPQTLACEVNASGQPRHVRNTLLQLRNAQAHRTQTPAAIPVLIAPYLSPEAQALCREQDVSFLDLEGNVRIVFDGIFIERQVASKPVTERRELRSMFKPKSAQVLRVMLRDPARAWRVTELAEAADVSLGHVSNVRNSLLDREWASVSDAGLYLSEPDALLDDWRGAYEPPAGKRQGFYTALHGSAFEDAARQVLRAEGEAGRAVFASFSAAHWLAPYGRTGTQYFHADEPGLQRLASALKLSPALKGENVVVNVLKEPGLFLDAVEPAPGAFCTGAVQTYLDLSSAGERGRESADHLRQEALQWLK
ncbi:hypothetical protein [Variovorax boronicumulans]|uniref:hypothetical protein n=1 Tax=Variovorax boronicumulans TaxID=436515 RepID=UPI003398ADA7